MKGGVTVANSKRCTCLVLMLLLLVKNAPHEYRNYIHPVHTLENVSNIIAWDFTLFIQRGREVATMITFDQVYTQVLNNVSCAYVGKCLQHVLFGELHNEAYWTPCHEPRICPDPKMKRNSKGCLVSSCIHIKMDIRESRQPKWCSMCRIPTIQKTNAPIM